MITIGVVRLLAVDRQLAAYARRFLVEIVPQSAASLKSLAKLARAIPDPGLREQALASIALKDFHVHGGCILATFLPADQVRRYVDLVATFETAVDYLDNLCDRAGQKDEADLRALHEALADAVSSRVKPREYFRFRSSDDGGYLRELVVQSQELFASLPSYAAIENYVADITARYCELQSLKHLPAGTREARCRETFAGVAPDLKWWEGAAASGSTMPTFALAFGAMGSCDAGRAAELYNAYFPYISAFHILLDYFIDQQEDREHHELNFVTAYGGSQSSREGLTRIGRIALERAGAARDAQHHNFAVRAMCGFYCSRKKVAQQHLEVDAAAIAASVGVDLGEAPWRTSGNRLLRPLLSLYNRMIRA